MPEKRLKANEAKAFAKKFATDCIERSIGAAEIPFRMQRNRDLIVIELDRIIKQIQFIRKPKEKQDAPNNIS